jgi:hypothetical protein
VARRRAQWLKYQDRIDPSRLVFIDETWTRTNMASLRGWAPRGERLEAKVPHGRWKTMTFLAALRSDRVEAPWLIDGPIDGVSFRLLAGLARRGPPSHQPRQVERRRVGASGNARQIGSGEKNTTLVTLHLSALPLRAPTPLPERPLAGRVARDPFIGCRR